MPLVLTRKLRQRFFVGDDVSVEVLNIVRGKVQLLVSAPNGLVIRREELSPLAVDHLRQRAGTALRIPSATEGQRP
jgi:carbon storage regulator